MTVATTSQVREPQLESTTDPIVSVAAATIRLPLPQPLQFGDYVISHREYVIARARSRSGGQGYGFALTRDGAIAETIRRLLAPAYVGTEPGAVTTTWRLAQSVSPAALSSGVGYRALSVVDLAVWDLVAKLAGLPVHALLGGSAVGPMAVAIVGFPPTQGGEGVAAEVGALRKAGWRRFKLPIAATLELTRERLSAAIEAGGPDSLVMFDVAWAWPDVATGVRYVEELGLELGWVEDPFVPREAAEIAELRQRISLPVAYGDDQGGSYYPEALLDKDAVDVLRIDATCMGGASVFGRLLDKADARGVRCAPHIFPHFHVPLLGGFGRDDVQVEWAIRGNGVDPLSDILEQPVIVEGGRMAPFPDRAGFGIDLDLAWLADQEVDDPDGIFRP